MKKLLVLSSALFLLSHSSFSQKCSSCFMKPSVVVFDLDMQIPPPETETDKAVWQELYSLGEMTRDYLSSTNRQCLRFVHPLTISTSQTTAPAANTSAELCTRADYMVSGNVKHSGEGYMLHLELQTSCNRKTIATSDQSFRASDDSSYLRSIAEKAASQLGRLAEKINEYAIGQRKADKDVALGTPGSTITIEPKKYNLIAGEETEVQVILKDCDGTILAGRNVNFNSESVGGTTIPGTTGGLVTPSQIITDPFGRATVKFKMGKEKSAVIRPHTVYKNPSGAQGVISSGTQIPKKFSVVNVFIMYERNEETTGDISAFMPLLKGAKKRLKIDQCYYGEFDHVSTDPASGYLVVAVPEEGQDRTLYFDELGTYDYIDDDPSVTLDTKGGAIEVQQEINQGKVEKIHRELNPARHTSVVFFMGKDGEPMRFQMTLNLENEEDLAEGASLIGEASVSIDPSTPGAEFTVRDLKNDPWYSKEYKIDYLVKDLGSMDEYNKLTGNHISRLEGGLHYTGVEILSVWIKIPR